MIRLAGRDEDPAGIKRAHPTRITEPFFSTKSKGTGLRIAVSRHIVDLHDGRMEIDSEEGKGTTVRISLPVSENTSVS